MEHFPYHLSPLILLFLPEALPLHQGCNPWSKTGEETCWWEGYWHFVVFFTRRTFWDTSKIHHVPFLLPWGSFMLKKASSGCTCRSHSSLKWIAVFTLSHLFSSCCLCWSSARQVGIPLWVQLWCLGRWPWHKGKPALAASTLWQLLYNCLIFVIISLQNNSYGEMDFVSCTPRPCSLFP